MNKKLSCLEAVSTSNLNGDCCRIVLYVAGTGKQCRLKSIEQALNLRKEHVSRYCKQLYKMHIFNKYNVNIGNRTFPLYSMNWNYTKSIQNTEVHTNE